MKPTLIVIVIIAALAIILIGYIKIARTSKNFDDSCDNENWTNKELAEIEEFKQFVISKRDDTPLPELPTMSIKKKNIKRERNG